MASFHENLYVFLFFLEHICAMFIFIFHVYVFADNVTDIYFHQIDITCFASQFLNG